MRYILILTILSIPAVYANESSPCSYLKKGEPELVQENTCISFIAWERPSDDPERFGTDARITKKVAVSARYNEMNLAFLYSKYGIFYFRESGKVRRTISYDNGPDYFQEGLARTSWNGKIGFIDKELNIVIPPVFDFAFPFQSGFSLVCNGCRKEPDGEYKKVVDGNWGFINKSGKTVIPSEFTKNGAIAALNKFRQGAQ